MSTVEVYSGSLKQVNAALSADVDEMQGKPRRKRAKKEPRPTTNSLSEYDRSIQDVIENCIHETYEPVEEKEEVDG